MRLEINNQLARFAKSILPVSKLRQVNPIPSVKSSRRQVPPTKPPNQAFPSASSARQSLPQSSKLQPGFNLRLDVNPIYSVRPMPAGYSVSAKRQSDLGQTMGKSELCGRQEDIGGMTSLTSNEMNICPAPILSATSKNPSVQQKHKRKVPSTVESPHTSSVMTYSARSTSCNKRIRATKSTKTSVQASNTNVKVIPITSIKP